MAEATECPVCEQPASNHVEVKRGRTWLDTFGKPPSSLFNKYMMIHVAPTSHNTKTAFLHTRSDVQ